MKRYNYRARDKATGKILKGAIQAESERAAGKLLIEQGYFPESLSEEDKDSIIAKTQNRVKTKDRIVFTRQFATLVGAGLPLSSSLRTMADQTQARGMKVVIEDLLAQVEGGKSLSDAMKMHPEVFNDVYLSLVAAGEMSGTLDESLSRLATQEEKDDAMISKIRQAMVYPAILLAVIIAVLIYMMTNVVPEVVNLYNSMKKTIPALTQFLFGVMNFFTNYWYLIVVAVIIIGVLIWNYKRTDSGKRFFSLVKLHVPLFNPLFRRLYMARFARTMEMLLGSGVAMLEAMRISARATANKVVEETILSASEKVKAGKTLSDSLKDKDYILPLIPQMASIGEESGKIDEMLRKAGSIYENELDERIKNISTLIEPVLLMVMALLVGVVLLGTLLPIYSLVSQI